MIIFFPEIFPVFRIFPDFIHFFRFHQFWSDFFKNLTIKIYLRILFLIFFEFSNFDTFDQISKILWYTISLYILNMIFVCGKYSWFFFLDLCWSYFFIREAATTENMVKLCETIWWTMQTNLSFELSWGQKNDSM